MSETPETPPALSRRDFLRRASREAVQTTAAASPMNLAKAAVGLSAKTPWWRKLAAWRKSQEEEKTEENARPDTPETP